MKKNFFISSLAFNNYSILEIEKIALVNNYNIEFTSSMKYSSTLLKDFLNLKIKKSLHNYFPPPKKEFVLNLASINENIRSKSIDHCINGLKIANEIKSSFYAAHAGFCLDPNYNELGNKINFNINFDRGLNKSIFIDSVKKILNATKDLDVNFLIENNVISKKNLNNNLNPLLCCESSEIIWLFNSINSSKFGLLLDTAHLKVSCKTLNKNLDNEFNLIRPFIMGIHHSDNDGNNDTNMSLSKKYWFLKYLNYFDNIPQVIEVKNLDENKINDQLLLLNGL